MYHICVRLQNTLLAFLSILSESVYLLLQQRLTTFREVAIEDGHGNREKFKIMMAEYEKYKDLWGQNIEYSHSAGPSQNYSEFDILDKFNLILLNFSQPRKGGWICKWCISFMTPQPLTEWKRM